MNPEQFREALGALAYGEFERFIVALLARTGRFREIQLNAVLNHYEVDILALESDSISGRSERWLFEVKRSKVVGSDAVRFLIRKRASILDQPVRFVLVTSGAISRAAMEILSKTDIQVWDANVLLRLATPELLERWFGVRSDPGIEPQPLLAKANKFQQALSGIQPGHVEWPAYQRLVADLLEFLFCPPLESPRYELGDADSHNRRDVIFENPGGNEFWLQVRGDYSALYIVVDAKNYAVPIGKRTVIDIAHYLKPYGCGMFALLVSRMGPDAGAMHATREQWIGGQKMIVHISDLFIGEMLDLKGRGGQPEEVIRRQIADFRMSL